MIEMLLAQLGITPDKLEQFKALALEASTTVKGFDTKLDTMQQQITALHAQLEKLGVLAGVLELIAARENAAADAGAKK